MNRAVRPENLIYFLLLVRSITHRLFFMFEILYGIEVLPDFYREFFSSMHSHNLFVYVNDIEDALFIYPDFVYTAIILTWCHGTLKYVRLSMIRVFRAVIFPGMRAGRDHVIGAAGLIPLAPDWSRSGRAIMPPGTLSRQVVWCRVGAYRMISAVTFIPCLLSGSGTRPNVRGEREIILMSRAQSASNDPVCRYASDIIYFINNLCFFSRLPMLSLSTRDVLELRNFRWNLSTTTLTTLKTS